MRDFNLRALQECEIDVLKEFVRVCEKNNLKYYLAWGSLLGAVRHQGFIPWDDDIDVCMPYEDYVRFREICKTQLDKEYFYEDWYTHPDFFLSWAKLRKNNTTCMTRAEANLKIHWGVCIDIFPLVRLDAPKCPFSKKIAKTVLNLIVKRSYLPYGADGMAKKLKSVIYAVVPKKWDKTIVEICYKIMGKSKKDAAYVWDFSNTIERCCLPAEVFEEGKSYEFENMMLNCPKDADAYLRKVYGNDYMVIPKVEDRIDHGDIIVDLEQDYSCYQSLKG